MSDRSIRKMMGLCAVVFYDELGYNNYSKFERSECYAKYKACV